MFGKKAEAAPVQVESPKPRYVAPKNLLQNVDTDILRKYAGCLIVRYEALEEVPRVDAGLLTTSPPFAKEFYANTHHSVFARSEYPFATAKLHEGGVYIGVGSGFKLFNVARDIGAWADFADFMVEAAHPRLEDFAEETANDIRRLLTRGAL